MPRPPGGNQPLSQLRAAHKLSLGVVAGELGVSKSLVRTWERGQLVVPSRHRPALAALLGIERADLDSLLRRTFFSAHPRAHPGERDTTADRMALAGMTQERSPGLYYLACLGCGRGTGPRGVFVWRHTQPDPAEVRPCATCGGKLFLEEVRVVKVDQEDGALGHGRHLQGAAA